MPTVEATVAFFTKHYPTAFPGGSPSVEFCQDFWSRKALSLRTTYCNKLAHGNVCLVRLLMPQSTLISVLYWHTRILHRDLVALVAVSLQLRTA
jgi:hypothetical protein